MCNPKVKIIQRTNHHYLESEKIIIFRLLQPPRVEQVVHKLFMVYTDFLYSRLLSTVYIYSFDVHRKIKKDKSIYLPMVFISH